MLTQCYPFIHSDDDATTKPADDLEILCASDYPAKPVEWHHNTL